MENTDKGEMTNISRIDTNRAHGWRVRFEQGGLQVSKLFSDRVCGGKEAARQEAIKYRDHMKSKLRTSQHEIGTKREDSGTNTGYVGVDFVSATESGSSQEYFNASVRLSPSKVIRRRFPLRKASYDRVLLQAVRWQRAVLKGRRNN